jgi:hypothetical protein
MTQSSSTPQPKPNGEKSSAPVSLRDAKPLEDQLREVYGRTAYSQKTHIIQAGIYQHQNWRIKTGQIVLAAVTTGGLIITLFGKDNQIGLVVGAICSSLLTALIAYTKDFDLGTLSEQHKRTADELWLIREKYLSLLTDMQSGALLPSNAMVLRDALLDDLNKVYAPAKVTTGDAYGAAQSALKFKEDLTFSDNEIDLMLPMSLRRNKDIKTLSAA